MEIEQPYQDALDYLYSFVDLSLTRALRYSPEKFNLERMGSLLTRLGNPHLKYPVIHVAGTKGKGSVTAMCASVLAVSGYKTGCYTSPHMQDFRERIRVDGKMISREDLVSLVKELKPHVAYIPQLSTFELTTAIAFHYFSRSLVDIAVIEVGLGGRLDATNLVKPLVSVITSISYDHMAILGDTLAKIAAEKAGIIKQDAPVVISPQKEEARQIIERIAIEHNSPLYQSGKDFLFSPDGHTLENQKFQVWPAGDTGNHPVFTIPLLGIHQVENACTAYTVLTILRKNGFLINDEDIQNGFARVTWPGRFEILNQRPFLVIDSAHNRDSALRLGQAMKDYFPDKAITLIFGASEDKDISGMYAELLPSVNRLITTQSLHPRAASAEQLATMAIPYNKPTMVLPQVEQALDTALRQVEVNDVVLAAGSVFIAAAVRDIWQRKASIERSVQ